MVTKSNSHTNNYLVVRILRLKTKLSVGEVRQCSVKLDQRRYPKDFLLVREGLLPYQNNLYWINLRNFYFFC